MNLNKLCDYILLAAIVILFMTVGSFANEAAPGEIHVAGWQWGMIAAFGLLVMKELIAMYRQRSTDSSKKVDALDLEKVDSSHCADVRKMCTDNNDRRFEEGAKQFAAFRTENKASHNQLHAKVDEIAKLVAKLG